MSESFNPFNPRICFKCMSKNTKTYRHKNAKIWCDDCGYVNRDEGSSCFNITKGE